MTYKIGIIAGMERTFPDARRILRNFVTNFVAPKNK